MAKAGLRIIGGLHRGRRLATPKGEDLLRPMRNQVRGALFNILGAERLEGARVLDLFAGSGSLGLEALSRGAQHAVFVDRAPPCLAVLRKNVATLGVGAQTTVLRHDLGKGVGALLPHAPFDLVLVHPPFVLLREAPGPGEPDVATLLASLATTAGILADDARIAFETPRACFRDEGSLPGLEVLLRREYGSTALFVATPESR